MRITGKVISRGGEGLPQNPIYHLGSGYLSPISELSGCGSPSVGELSRTPSRLLTPTLEALCNYSKYDRRNQDPAEHLLCEREKDDQKVIGDSVYDIYPLLSLPVI